MTIAELREQYSKLMADAKALIPADGKVTSEIRTKFEAMHNDAKNLAFVIETLEVEERSNLEQRGKNLQLPNIGEHATVGNTETRNKEVRDSFVKYMRTGHVETRDLTAAATGVFVPQLFNPSIYEAEKSYGDIYNLVTIMKTKDGNPMKLVYDNDTSNSLVSVTSGTDVSEVDPSTSSATLTVDNFSTGVIKVDMALLQDAGFDVEAWIRNRFAERFYRGVAGLIYNGDAGAVASLATAYSGGFTTATSGAIKYADFTTAIATLDPAYQTNAIWGVSNATLAYIVGITDSNGRPIFLPDYGAGDKGFVGSILGYPVKLITQMPSVAAGNTAVLFGDFKKAYTLRQQDDGLQILRLNERYAASYEVGFVGFCRLGGVATNYGATPLIGATIHV